jgi:hypothetical protein
MPTIRWTDDSEEGRAREELIKTILPTEPITGAAINDKILSSTRKKAIEMLKKEIEIYRAFPKKGTYDPDNFTPRNSRKCFMGQAFSGNGHGFEGWTDHDLKRYREAIGVISHETWGDATLLEIWGGDHFEKHPKMVKNVFLYGWGKIDDMPPVKFYINPFNKNKESGTWEPDPDEIFQEKSRLHLLKVANYIEIRDRLKAAKLKNPMSLAINEEDDPKPSKYR